MFHYRRLWRLLIWSLSCAHLFEDHNNIIQHPSSIGSEQIQSLRSTNQYYETKNNMRHITKHIITNKIVKEKVYIHTKIHGSSFWIKNERQKNKTKHTRYEKKITRKIKEQFLYSQFLLLFYSIRIMKYLYGQLKMICRWITGWRSDGLKWTALACNIKSKSQRECLHSSSWLLNVKWIPLFMLFMQMHIACTDDRCISRNPKRLLSILFILHSSYSGSWTWLPGSLFQGEVHGTRRMHAYIYYIF